MILRLILTLLLLAALPGQGRIAHAANGIQIEDDLFMGVWSPYVRRWRAEVPLCLWSDEGDLFRITASGLTPGNAFSLTNDLGDQVRYKVILHSGRLFKRRERLRQDRPSRLTYPSAVTQYCQRGYTARIRVDLNKGDIDRAIPAIYSDTLMLVISPL